jgi:LmbE family N-acetylglucosaminyl deacetylase
MREFILKGGRRLRRILCFGAHCDDIEIGCGGALLVMQAGAAVRIDWVVLSGSAQRRAEAAAALRALVRPAARGQLHFGDFPDGRFPGHYDKIKEFFEALKRLPRPDLILCHERDDRHQDHRAVNEHVWSTFRDHTILEYEVPKWDGGLGQPNVYVPVTAAQARRKVAALLESYRSQARRDWFDAQTFMGLLRLRGIECRSPSGYAEGFYGRKIRLAAA